MHGNARYEIDQKYEAKDSDHCRKTSYGHPTLSLLVYSLFFVCVAFAMATKSCVNMNPHVTLSKFSRLDLREHCICRSIVSIENQSFFKQLVFFVDRFYWQGHVGCTSRYCLDKYPSQDIAQINSQANAGLQRIKAQLSYMSLDNSFVTLLSSQECRHSKEITYVVSSSIFLLPLILLPLWGILGHTLLPFLATPERAKFGNIYIANFGHSWQLHRKSQIWKQNILPLLATPERIGFGNIYIATFGHSWQLHGKSQNWKENIIATFGNSWAHILPFLATPE